MNENKPTEPRIGFNFDFLPPEQRISAICRAEEILTELDKAPSSTGAKYMRTHYAGKHLTARQRAMAKCCDCSCYYADGREDCQVFWCILYPLMPYGKMRKRYPSKAKKPKETT